VNLGQNVILDPNECTFHDMNIVIVLTLPLCFPHYVVRYAPCQLVSSSEGRCKM
jgi:hypothetical protein